MKIINTGTITLEFTQEEIKALYDYIGAGTTDNSLRNGITEAQDDALYKIYRELTFIIKD
jgi:hypothetical protein